MQGHSKSEDNVRTNIAPGDSRVNNAASTAVVANSNDDEQGTEERGLLGRLLKHRTITLFGAVTENLTKRVVSSLLLLDSEDPEAPITLVQNTPGGSVNDGFAIYDTLRFIRAPVRIVCVGLTASIGTVTLLGAKKENRLSLPNTRFLIHQPMIPGHIFGPASDLEITAQEILKTREKINQLLAEETNMPMERVSLDTQRDYWMDAHEALEYGLISGVVSSWSDLSD
jgi:ATP-dependent Clp protease protease subunit